MHPKTDRYIIKLMKFSHELPPKEGAKNKEGMGKKFRKLVLPFALLFGAGAGTEAPGKNSAEKSAKPAAEFKIENPKKQYEAIENKVVKSGADTFKTDGNMSMEQLQEEMTGEAPEEFKSDYDIEKSKFQKSGADTYKSDGNISVE